MFFFFIFQITILLFLLFKSRRRYIKRKYKSNTFITWCMTLVFVISIEFLFTKLISSEGYNIYLFQGNYYLLLFNFLIFMSAFFGFFIWPDSTFGLKKRVRQNFYIFFYFMINFLFSVFLREGDFDYDLVTVSILVLNNYVMAIPITRILVITYNDKR